MPPFEWIVECHISITLAERTMIPVYGDKNMGANPSSLPKVGFHIAKGSELP